MNLLHYNSNVDRSFYLFCIQKMARDTYNEMIYNPFSHNSRKVVQSVNSIKTQNWISIVNGKDKNDIM